MDENSRIFFKESDNQFDYSYCLLNGIEEIANSHNIPSEIFEIVSLFQNTCDKPLEKVGFKGNTLSITGRNSVGKHCVLSLRLRNNKLDVKTVEFPEQRRGYMTAFYGLLKEIQSKYDLDKVTIEAVCSEEMELWCSKFNFTEYKPDFYIEQ